MEFVGFTLRNNLFVAPMAGVTDRPFRQLCKNLGAGLAVSEMVTSNSLLYGSKKTLRRANHEGEVAPISVQIAGAKTWPIAHADAIVCINMIHISPWRATLGLAKGAERILQKGGLLYLYGPYLRKGIPTAEGNLAFDQSLRSRDPEWGLRALEVVTEVFAECNLRLESFVEMPANNLSVMFRRG